MLPCPNVAYLLCDARLVGEHDTRLWRVIQHYVEDAVARSKSTSIGHLR
jgi:hypothetical protein